MSRYDQLRCRAAYFALIGPAPTVSLAQIFAIPLLSMLLVLAGCAGNQGIAPVDDRATESTRGIATDTASAERAVSARQHRVIKGDTLYSIAFANNLYFPDIAKWNRIRKPYLIKIGQVLNLYPPSGSSAWSRGRSDMVKSKQASPHRSRTDASQTSAGSRTEIRSASRKSNKEVQAKRVQTKSVSRVRWTWPTRGKLIRKFSSRGLGKKGIAIVGKPGQPVRSAARGRVVYAGSGLVGYGKLIIVKHNRIFLSAYAHNRKLLVKEGDRVEIGQPIAEMGSTGTDRTMLHFEIRRRGKPVNPLSYLP